MASGRSGRPHFSIGRYPDSLDTFHADEFPLVYDELNGTVLQIFERSINDRDEYGISHLLSSCCRP